MSYTNFSNTSSNEYEDLANFLRKDDPGAPGIIQNDSIFLHSCLVLLVRAGFVLVQLASIPSHNVFVIIYQNVVDIALSIASFGSVGYVVAFGEDLKGVIGFKKWFNFANATDIHNAIVGLLATLIAMAIITTILCGRISNVGYFIFVFVLSAFIQPAIIHWVWHSEGWLYSREFLGNEVSFRDHSGGLIIHVFGGVVSLIGALFFGRRLMLLSSISELSIGAESPGSSFVGYIFIVTGLMGFSLTSFSYEKKTLVTNFSGILILNNLAGMSGGILVIIFLQHVLYKKTINYWNLLRCIQGGVAGIVAVAPGLDLYTPLVSFALASTASVVFYCVSICLMEKTSIEDYCNIISIHLVCGIIGLAFPPLIGNSEDLCSQTIKHRLINSVWQIISTLTVVLFLIVICTNLFCGILLCKRLRNDTEQIDHERGVAAAKKQENDKTFLDRLIKVTSLSSYLEPGPSSRNLPQMGSENDSALPEKKDTKKLHKTLHKLPYKRHRFPYTIPNVSYFESVPEDYLRGCCGDNFYRSLSTENLSCYNLHRTRKAMNLFSVELDSKKNVFNSFVRFQEV